MNKILTLSIKLRRAKHISRTLGMYCAAKYLANQGISIETAKYVLLNK